MFLSDLSIKRPVLAAVMMLALATLGIFSYRRLAVDFFPDIEVPVLTVITVFPGAAPESVEREVSKRIEEAVNPIAGVKDVGSISREGVSQVWVEFELGVRINDAAQEARAKIAAIRGDLPQGIEEPIIEKLDFSAMPIVSFSVRSETMSARDLSTLVEKKVQRRLQNLTGVGKVNLIGPARREVNVDLDLDRLQALGMGVDEVVAGLQSENVNTPLGRLNRGSTEVPIRISGKPDAVEHFQTMVVAERAGRPITLGEVATVRDGVEEQRSLALVDGVPAVALDVLKQSGANIVDTVERVKREITVLQEEMPPGVEIEMIQDSSIWIRESVADVQQTLVLGGILTVLIVFVFLNSWRSTVITGLTLPISVIAAFIVMNFGGMTINVITLMALSLAIGLLIDDAIVVRENIVRHLERGEDHFTAASNGTAEIGLAVLATSMSIMCVFVPVAFMKGIVGRVFYHFGITVAFAVAISLFVSFTLDPMLSSRWHDPAIARTGRRPLLNRLLDVFNDWFDRTADRYRSLIVWSLDHRKSVVALAAAAFVGGLGVMGLLQGEFMTTFDQGEFQVNLVAAPDASIRETESRVRAVLAAIGQEPEVERTYATIGAGDTGTVRDASIYVKLVDRHRRTRTQLEVQRDLRGRLSTIPGITPSFAEPGNLDTRKPMEASVRGEDLEQLKAYAALLKSKLYGVQGLVDLEMSLEQETPEYRLLVDRERASDLGVSTADIVRTVGVLVGGQAVSTFEDEDGDAIDVRLRLPSAAREDATQVQDLRLAVDRSGGATLVPLGEVISYERSATPSEIVRRDLVREVVVSANLDELPLGTAVQKVEEIAAGLDLAPGYRVVMAGQNEEMVESFRYLFEALFLAVILVYLILAAQFESFLDPFAIMLSLPLSIVGMAGMLLATGDTINIMSLIGLIMLMGLVTKNAILLIDFAKKARKRGLARREALIEAGRIRLRPIMMTTVAMIFGMLPTALAIGAGGEMRAPMARAVVGGLITSTLLTLIVVPVVYTLLDDVTAWLRRHFSRAAREQELAANNGIAALLLLGLVVGLAGGPAAAAETAPTSAPAPLALTLEQALRLAAEQNRDLQKAIELRRWVQGKYVEERAAALPHLSVNGSGARRYDASQEDFFADLPAELGAFFAFQQDVATAELGLSQALFTWGQVGAAIRAARVGMVSADDQLEQQRQVVERDVSAAFYDVLLAKELVAIADQSLAQRQRHLEDARHRYALGTATDFDVLAAEVDVKNARPDVIHATNAVANARKRLALLLAQERDVDAVGSLEAEVSPWPQAEAALAEALARRPDLRALEHRRQAYAELVKIARAGDKPRLDLQAGYGHTWLELPELSSDGRTWHAGLYLSFPFFDGLKTRGRVVEAKSDYATAQLDEANLRQAIALEVQAAVDAVVEATQVLDALAGTVQQAERLLEMAEQGYELGVKTKLEVDDAQLAVTQAKGGLARAQRDYQVARVFLEYVTGSLGTPTAD